MMYINSINERKLSFRFGYSPHNIIMWVHFALFLLAGTALANAAIWEKGRLYRYHVQTRAMTGANTASRQFSGLLTKGDLLLYIVEEGTMVVEVRNNKYASFHTEIASSWDEDIDEKNRLDYVDMPLSQKPYKVKFISGRILEMFANPGVPMWEVNIVKGMLSQLQYSEDLELRSPQELIVIPKMPTKNDYVTYTVREQSVSGDCDTTYDIIPLTEDVSEKVHLVPIPDLENDEYIDVMKNKDFGNCSQLPMYQFAVTRGKSEFDKFVVRTAKTNMIFSYNKEHYTIRLSVTKNKIHVRPECKDLMTTDVLTMLNMTLVQRVSIKQWPVIPTDVKSVGNLTYIYSNSSLDDTWTESVLRDLEFDSKSGESDEPASGTRLGVLINKTDLLYQAILLNRKIAEEIITDNILEQNTLEKFTILTDVLRLLNETDLKNLTNTLFPWDVRHQKDEIRIVKWKILQDAVTQAGTGPAFLTIRWWITSKMVTDFEAAQIVSRLPRTVRAPTMKYIDAFYELIKDPKLKDQLYLNSTAPFAFSELIRYVMGGYYKDLYFTRVYGKLITREDAKWVINTYIPYLSNELKKAYEEKHISRILTYTEALGNLAHPNVILVLKPYLEGKYNVTTFQRMRMIMSLTTLSQVQPNLIRPIVYRIFQNQEENSRIRVVAVGMLLNSYPSLRILQRLADRTNYETCPYVNSAIKTGLRSLANSRLPQYREVAKNARIVWKLLNRHIRVVVGQALNHGHDYTSTGKDFSTWFNLNTLDGSRSIIPDFLNLQVGLNSSSLSPPDLEFGYGVTDLTTLMDTLKEMFLPNDEPAKPTTVDEVVSNLDIRVNKSLLEGLIVSRNPYGVYLLPFDNYTVQNLMNETLKLYGRHRVDERPYFHLNSLVNWEVSLFYPNEMGVPVSYHLKTPALVSLKNDVHIKGETKPVNMKVSADLNVLLSGKVISRIGFTAPFEKQYYISGIDFNTQLHGSGNITVNMDWTEKTLNLDYKPLPGLTRNTVLHHSIIPFTGKTETCSFEPIYVDKNTQKVQIGKLQSQVTKLGKITITHVTDNFYAYNYETLVNGNLYQRLMSYIATTNYNYKKIDVTVDSLEDYKLSAFLSYNRTNSPDSSQERPELLNTLTREMSYTFKKEDNVPAVVHKVEVHAKLGDKKVQYKCEGGVMELEPLLYGKLYGRCHLRGSDVSAICAIGELYGTPSACPTLNVTSLKEDGVDLLVRYGESCSDGKDVRLEGRTVQSLEVMEKLAKSEKYRKAKEEMAEGNLGLTNTREVCESIDTRDDISLTAKMDPVEFENIYNQLIRLLGNVLLPGWKIGVTEPINEYSLKTSDIGLKIKKLPKDMLNLTVSTPKLIINTILDNSDLPSLELVKKQCTLGRNKVLTFDGLEYPVKLRGIPYVLMISPSLKNYSLSTSLNYDIITKIEAMPEDTNVAILAKELENGHRQLIILNREKILIFQLASVGRNTVIMLNGKVIKFQGNHAVLQNDKNSVILITKLTYELYRISMKIAGVYINYDGRRVQIEASNMYNGLVRGLCGNKDDHKKNDLLTPAGCVVKESKYLVVLYAYDKDNEDEVVRREKEEAKRAKCVKLESSPGEVVTGKVKQTHGDPWYNLLYGGPGYNLLTLCSLLRTDVLTRKEDICFSVKPLLKCLPGCKFDRMVTKQLGYHCMPMSDQAVELKKRVVAGANPDFSHKSISYYRDVNVPNVCHTT
ncbi:PREDICTED: vitellogenin-2-like [Dinoponera quadriceps]|uniref:Vitellogenin-2-like n=1 Tax=Dinoponera quadriceps TaxID=609295 RepID=A0A6P3WQQ6_DINQU|nr:PREDICTED: vitellogenin-2-like [Dinoponera quadriceps]